MLTVESRWWIYEYTLHNSFNFSGMWWGDRLQGIRCFHSEQLKVRNNMTLMGLPIRTMSTVHYDARVRGDSNFNYKSPSCGCVSWGSYFSWATSRVLFSSQIMKRQASLKIKESFKNE